MSRTAQTARMLEAATADIKRSLAASHPNEWLLGALIGKIQLMDTYRSVDLHDRADAVLADAMALILDRLDAMTPSYARQHSEESF